MHQIKEPVKINSKKLNLKLIFNTWMEMYQIKYLDKPITCLEMRAKQICFVNLRFSFVFSTKMRRFSIYSTEGKFSFELNLKA